MTKQGSVWPSEFGVCHSHRKSRVRLGPVACPNNFSAPVNQDISNQCALSWKKVVSDWRSVIAVSLKFGGGIRLIKPANLYMCTQKHYKHNKNGCTAQAWFCITEPLGERLHKNWNTYTQVSL